MANLGDFCLKHGPAIAGYESALKKFFENVLQAFLKHIDFNVVRCAVIASPGFTKDQFHCHLLLEAKRRQLRPIIENKSRIILVHTSSGYKYFAFYFNFYSANCNARSTFSYSSGRPSRGSILIQLTVPLFWDIYILCLENFL